MKPLRIAVFASGSGTNFQAVVDAVREGRVNATVELLVCDKPDAQVVKRAEAARIPSFVFRPKEYPSREAYELEIIQRLQELQIDLIVMAGYMRLITSTLVEPYYGRLINVHPSLLPVFPGVRAVQQAWEYGVKITGVTVHYVDGGMDTGPIIGQRIVPIREGDTISALEERIHSVEHELLPEVIGWICEGRVVLEGRKTTILPVARPVN